MEEEKTFRDPACTILLTPWEYDHAVRVGTQRIVANWKRPNAPHYDKSRMEDDRTAQVAATICELAVAKHTNRYWHAHVWHPLDHRFYADLPDVGMNIEVRRVRTGNNVAVRRSQLNRDLVVWAAHPLGPEFRRVELLGWMKYDEAWEAGEPASYDPEKTRLVPIERLTL